jgi:hypothetical protein
MRRRKKTIEQWADEGADLVSCIREESILLHTTTPHRNTLEAHVTCSMTLPDGTLMVANRRIRLQFTVEETD